MKKDLPKQPELAVLRIKSNTETQYILGKDEIALLGKTLRDKHYLDPNTDLDTLKSVTITLNDQYEIHDFEEIVAWFNKVKIYDSSNRNND